MTRTSTFTDNRPKPEPLNVRRERQAAESQDAWKEYRAKEEAVNRNMERLRALRLARADEVAPAAERRTPKKAAVSKADVAGKPKRKRGKAA